MSEKLRHWWKQKRPVVLQLKSEAGANRRVAILLSPPQPIICPFCLKVFISAASWSWDKRPPLSNLRSFCMSSVINTDLACRLITDPTYLQQQTLIGRRQESHFTMLAFPMVVCLTISMIRPVKASAASLTAFPALFRIFHWYAITTTTYCFRRALLAWNHHTVAICDFFHVKRPLTLASLWRGNVRWCHGYCRISYNGYK